MQYWEYLDLDEKTKNALKSRDREFKNKKIILLFFLFIVLIISYLLKSKGLLMQNTFELIFVAFVGGFIGSALGYIINGEK